MLCCELLFHIIAFHPTHSWLETKRDLNIYHILSSEQLHRLEVWSGWRFGWGRIFRRRAQFLFMAWLCEHAAKRATLVDYICQRMSRLFASQKAALVKPSVETPFLETDQIRIKTPASFANDFALASPRLTGTGLALFIRNWLGLANSSTSDVKPVDLS